MSLRLPPLSVQASGMPLGSTKRWCLEPARPRSTGLGPVAEPLFSPAHGSKSRPRATLDLAPGAAALQQEGVQPLPDAGPLPLVESAIAGRARAEAELER